MVIWVVRCQRNLDDSHHFEHCEWMSQIILYRSLICLLCYRWLHLCRFSGAIPSELSTLDKLVDFHLFGNQLYGLVNLKRVFTTAQW